MGTKFAKRVLGVAIASASMGAGSLALASDWSGPYGGATLSATTLEASGSGGYYGESRSVRTGATLGLLGGINFQNRSAVYGVEADFSTGTRTAGSYTYSADQYYQEAEWNWFSTVRGRVGLAVDNVLVFATAGLAIVDIDHRYCDEGVSACNDGDSDNASLSGTEYGIAVGAGVEMALTDKLNLRLDMLQIDLDTRKVDRDGYPNDIYKVNFASSVKEARLSVLWSF